MSTEDFRFPGLPEDVHGQWLIAIDAMPLSYLYYIFTVLCTDGRLGVNGFLKCRGHLNESSKFKPFPEDPNDFFSIFMVLL